MQNVETRDDVESVSVVYVHGNTSVRTSVSSALERGLDASVREADCAERARSMLSTTGADCVVTAYELPDTDGISLQTALRDAGCSTPVVIHAANGSETAAANALAADVAAYVPVDDPADDHESLVEAVDDVVSRGDSIETLRRRWQTVESLHDVALEFEHCRSPEETYQFAVDAMSQVLPVYACVIYVAEDNLLVPKATVGDVPGGWQPYGIDEGVAGRTYQDGSSSRTDHIPSSREASPVGAELRSGISVPVGSFGVLQAVSTQPAAYDEHDQKLAELLSAHVSAAVSRIQSEEAVKAERDRFATLFEHVPDAVAITRGEAREVVEMNPAFESIFGFDRTELLGEPIDEYIIPEDGDAINVIEEAGTDEVVRDEVRRQGADETREFLFKGFAIEDGTDFREYAIYTDITERKNRERALRRYKRLVQAVGDPMYVLTADGRVEMINAAMAEVLGRSADEVRGLPADAYMPATDVETGTKLLAELIDDDRRDWETFEMTVEPVDGDSFVAETKVSPLINDGEFTGSVGVIRDISRRKERERRIRELHEGTRLLMAAEGAEAVAEVASTVAAEALGLEINGVHLYDDEVDGLVPVANSKCALELLGGDPPVIETGGGLMWDAYEAGEPIAHGDVRSAADVRNPDTPIRSEAYIPIGEHGLLVVSSTEVADFDEEALTLAKILSSNVEAALERAERESTLADRTRELERQNERLDEFAGTVSHDLRNPLTLANGHLDVARETADEDTDRHLSEVDWALSRMDDLIADVLELARSGRQLTSTEPVSLDAVVSQAHRTVDPDLDVAVDGPLDTVEGSAQRLLALFENCVRNAREHVGEDVTVTVRTTPDGFAIDDDGPGIPPDERRSVLETGYTTAETGTGFGLSIVADVAEAHGWSIDIEESPDGGARIHIRTDEGSA
ncbi:PAS domain S-box protein [Halovivax gelatinilyticus]|uniref:PAS domain S-box protein n=1 Tax=Halovivax gelatinilyticus TaxID=2961597 RepID=UPI0020CA84AF|nr:PAS domain S-box protein [Halovivax gelatinilyticus]